jgi:hypothetical protein
MKKLKASRRRERHGREIDAPPRAAVAATIRQPLPESNFKTKGYVSHPGYLVSFWST